MKVLPSPGRADKADFAAQQRRQFAADGQTETRAAETPARAGVGLVERLEDNLLFVRRNADAGIADFKSDHARRAAQAPDDPSSSRLRQLPMRNVTRAM